MDDLDKLIAKLDEDRDREAVELVWPVFGDRTPTGLVLAAIAKPSSVDMALRRGFTAERPAPLPTTQTATG